MPRQAMDYSKCVIYKIICNNLTITECYVGHTNNFVKRKYQHKHSCNTINCKLYQMIRENGGWDNWTMTPICEYPCENYIQACIKEEEYRIELQSSLNNNKCYIELSRDKYKKKWAEEHKEEIAEKAKEKYQKNKEIVAEKNKIYRDENKEILAEKRKNIYTCSCGSILTICKKSRHEKTKKHQDFMKTTTL